jgi:hypothetical protein
MSNPFSNFFSGLSATALVSSFGSSACFAHPDHPVQVVSNDSALHYFLQPEHALPLVVFAVAMLWISRCVKAHLAARVPAKKVIHVENRRRG